MYLIIDARSLEEARLKALGMKVSCPWGPLNEKTHDFVVKNILGVSVYPWKPPVTISSIPIPSVVVKEMITSEIGERFWVLSKKGEDDFEEIKRKTEEIIRLTPVPTTTRRGTATVGSAVLIALLVIGVSVGGYYLWKRFKGS